MAKVMISLPDVLLRQIDSVAKKEHRKRSEFFKELAVNYLHARARIAREFADLECASESGLAFWDNPIDDETWNATPTA